MARFDCDIGKKQSPARRSLAESHRTAHYQTNCLPNPNKSPQHRKRAMPPSDFEPLNANVHGDVPGVPVGTRFLNRDQLYHAGVHGRPKWGIHGTEEDGAFAIVLNGGYEDDVDRGDVVIYTGHGKGKSETKRQRDKMLGIGSHSQGRQVGDQTWTGGNLALRTSCRSKFPVRVIRGPDGNITFSPDEGYRYDGLYEVTKSWEETGKEGFKICRFELVRCPDQEPLPNNATAKNYWTPPVPRRLRKYLEAPEEPASPRPKKRPSGWTKEKRDAITGNRKYAKLPRIPKKKPVLEEGEIMND